MTDQLGEREMGQEGPADANELSQVIESLRANIEEAQRSGAGHDVRLLINEIEIELNVATTGEIKAVGGIKFWVLNFGSEVKGQLQKLNLKLKILR